MGQDVKASARAKGTRSFHTAEACIRTNILKRYLAQPSQVKLRVGLYLSLQQCHNLDEFRAGLFLNAQNAVKQSLAQTRILQGAIWALGTG